MKTEIWNGYNIRFVQHNGEWWAVAKDVCDALSIKNSRYALRTIKGVVKYDTLTKGGEQQLNIICEKDIYRLVFKSRKTEAEQFQDWVYQMLKDLRVATGLEGFEIFRMLDKEHQKEAMKKLHETVNATKVDYIKANTIADKAVSSKYGCPKMVKKENMTPQMLVDREPILDDVVELMGANKKFDLGVSVSKQIYKKVAGV